MQFRDAELHAVERERALSRLLIDISAACAAAPGLDALVSTYLGRLALGLGTCNGWVAVGRPRRVDVYGVHGLLPDKEAEPLVALLERIGPGVGHGAVAIVPPEDLARIPAADPSGIAVLCGFLRRWRRPGWVLLVGDRSSGLLTEGESVLSATATMIGLAATRLEGTETLWKLSERLEQQVRRRTAELSLERDRLEDRVRERTAELEQAKRSALASERRLLDAEREERVHHLAAGVAHTLNNPLASVLANLDFALEALERPAGSRPLPEAELEEVRQAVTDARMDAGRIDDLVKSSFGDAARARRGAVRTNLGRGVEDAIAHHREATGHRRPILVRLAGKTVVGIPPAALTRWILRILSAAGGSRKSPSRSGKSARTDCRASVCASRTPSPRRPGCPSPTSSRTCCPREDAWRSRRTTGPSRWCWSSPPERENGPPSAGVSAMTSTTGTLLHGPRHVICTLRLLVLVGLVMLGTRQSVAVHRIRPGPGLGLRVDHPGLPLDAGHRLRARRGEGRDLPLRPPDGERADHPPRGLGRVGIPGRLLLGLVLMAAIVEGIGTAGLNAIFVSILYAALTRWGTPLPQLLDFAVVSQFVFFFLIALLMGHMADRTRHEARDRHHAERACESVTTELRQSTEALKAAREALRASDRLATLGMLSAGIAHEIRNPLSAIANNLVGGGVLRGVRGRPSAGGRTGRRPRPNCRRSSRTAAPRATTWVTSHGTWGPWPASRGVPPRRSHRAS